MWCLLYMDRTENVIRSSDSAPPSSSTDFSGSSRKSEQSDIALRSLTSLPSLEANPATTGQNIPPRFARSFALMSHCVTDTQMQYPRAAMQLSFPSHYDGKPLTSLPLYQSPPPVSGESHISFLSPQLRVFSDPVPDLKRQDVRVNPTIIKVIGESARQITREKYGDINPNTVGFYRAGDNIDISNNLRPNAFLPMREMLKIDGTQPILIFASPAGYDAKANGTNFKIKYVRKYDQGSAFLFIINRAPDAQIFLSSVAASSAAILLAYLFPIPVITYASASYITKLYTGVFVNLYGIYREWQTDDFIPSIRSIITAVGSLLSVFLPISIATRHSLIVDKLEEEIIDGDAGQFATTLFYTKEAMKIAIPLVAAIYMGIMSPLSIVPSTAALLFLGYSVFCLCKDTFYALNIISPLCRDIEFDKDNIHIYEEDGTDSYIAVRE